MTFDHFLVILHFIGLALGFASGFGNAVVAGIIAKAAPNERPILARVPPALGRLGVVGLALLWITGLTIVYTRYGTFSILPRTFIIKIGAVVLMTICVVAIQVLQGRAQRGDQAAVARIQLLGRITGPLALTAVIFAVLTFG